MRPTSQELTDWLIAAGINNASGIAAEIAADGATPVDVWIQKLCERKLLTEYQAQELGAGRGSRLLLGNYVVRSKLGQGGMGQVFLAEHRRMKRLVALKLLPAHITRDPQAVARFQREVQAAARVSHPHIVTAFDADEVGGIHFFAMEYVDGCDLSSLIKRQGPLPVTVALDYTRQTAEGLAYSHELGIIHRDIKPANLLVDRRGQVKILDLGLARLLQTADTVPDDLTGTGMVMGTVDYMSPEQAMNTHEADDRSDIYSLGCTLYTLLTARPADEGSTVMQKLLAHREQPIPEVIATDEHATFAALLPAVNTLLKRLLAKHPGDRPATMREVADELQRLLKPGSPGETTSQLQLDSALQAFIAAAPGPATKAGTLTEVQIDQETLQSAEFEHTVNYSLSYSKPLKSTVRKPKSQRRAIAGITVGVLTCCVLAGLYGLNSGPTRPAPKTIPAEIPLAKGTSPPSAPAQPVASNVEESFWAPCDPEEALPGLVPRPAIIPGLGRWQLVFGDSEGRAQRVAYSPDGKLIAVASRSGTIRLLDAESMELRQLLTGHTDWLKWIAWHPTSSRLASLSSDGVRIWDPAGRSVSSFSTGSTQPLTVGWHPERLELIIANPATGLQTWTPEGQLLQTWKGPDRGWNCAQWSPNGDTLIAGTNDGHIFRWEATGTPLDPITAHNGPVNDLEWKRDGKSFASGGDDGIIRIWKNDGQAEQSFEVGTTLKVSRLAWLADGATLVAGLINKYTESPAIAVLQGVGKVTFLENGSYQRDVSAHPILNRFVSASLSIGIVTEYEQQDGKTSRRHQSGYSWCQTNVVDASVPEGQFLAGMINLKPTFWDLAGARKDELFEIPASNWSLAWKPDFSEVAIGGSTLLIRDSTSSTSRQIGDKSYRQVYCVDWNPTGDQLVAGYYDGFVRFWKADGTLLAEVQADSKYVVNDVAWSPDGHWVAVAAHSDGCQLWDATLSPPRKVRDFNIPGFSTNGVAVAWSADNRYLSFSLGSFVFMVEQDFLAGPLLSQSPMQAGTRCMKWDSRSLQFASGASDGLLHVHQATGFGHRAIRAHPGGIYSLSWTPDDKRIVTAGHEGSIRVWNLETEQPEVVIIPMADGSSVSLTGGGMPLSNVQRGFNNLRYIVEREDKSLEILTAPEFAARVKNLISSHP